MSADNWTTCPRCEADSKRHVQERVALAEASYGKVSASEYRKLIADAEELRNHRDLEETLREDYHLGMTSDGKFKIHYRARCEQCGFEFQFDKESDPLAGASV